MLAKTTEIKRFHRMPFGAQVLKSGGVRFRLWAPALSQVSLRLDENELLPMQDIGQGWYELITTRAHVGSRYRYQITDNLCVPDPASRFNSEDVHGCSTVIDASAFHWQDSEWHGLPWQESIIYELHVGTFTTEGTFSALELKLDYLVELGITAIELMPLAQFPGNRNWGYDGTLLFAPHSDYGSPDELKRLIQSAHQKGLMVFLDVVYNHFGPEGNYLHHYAPQFFTERHHTPWGAAINFDGEDSRTVRDFFIHNALYWLEEYHFDGLRLDAVHAILDHSGSDFLLELSKVVRAKLGQERHIHLVLENDSNAAHYLEQDNNGRLYYEAQWNDDIHHASHVLLTGEREGYYADYHPNAITHLCRCLSEGFAYQGELSRYRGGQPRGEASGHLPPTAFVSFLQNHDQIGNRAFGERLSAMVGPEALTTATALLLLTPQIPLLFMGEEWGASEPFVFFCNFEAGLADAVTESRRNAFSRFTRFKDPATLYSIPDPSSEQSFISAKLNWMGLNHLPHSKWLTLHRQLLALRRRIITPRLLGSHSTGSEVLSAEALWNDWLLGDGSQLTVIVNFGVTSVKLSELPAGELIYSHPSTLSVELHQGVLPAHSIAWYLEDSNEGI